MNIGRQWEDRLKMWSLEFEKYYLIKGDELKMSYYTTMEHLKFEDAIKGDFAPAPTGTKWGAKWEYGWFKTSVVIPSELEGKRVVFTLNTAEEMLVWVNGVEAGAIDKKHRFITLSRDAKAGSEYEIYAECYAGHGVRDENAGPVGYGVISIPEPPQAQVTTGKSYIAEWNEELFQVAMDYQTLYNLVPKLPEKSLRAMKIIEALKKFTYVADFELPIRELTASVVEAGKILKPLLKCTNGSTAPDYTIFGQSHLDLAWLWPVEETVRKTARTYSNQLALMEEYDDYKFLLCEPPILECLKKYYPNVYKRVIDKVKEGVIMPEGALWVESDTNIPSGESLIRQFIKGKRYYKDELDVDTKMAWMPDTFGFSAVLPQIMAGCDIPYFATQKLVRQDPEAEAFPYNIFWWEGMDGSRVLAHSFKKNNAVFKSGDLITRWEEDRVQQENVDGYMYPFGYGDGGGGPTRDMIEVANRCKDLEGAPRCSMENPVRFFEKRLKNGVDNTYKGELYLAWHRGTLTSQSETKRGIRKAEVVLKKVEYHMAKRAICGLEIKKAWCNKLDELWEILLFNQFHDIAPGTSIKRVHDHAVEELWKVITEGEKLITEMVGEACDETNILVYNHLGFTRKYHGYEVPAQGCALIEQDTHLKDVAKAKINVVTGKSKTSDMADDVVKYYELKNENIICKVNTNGEIISVKKVGNSKEYLDGVGNKFLMYKDVNTCYDAWELGSMYENLPVDIDINDDSNSDTDKIANKVEISVCEEENGAALLVTRKINESEFVQKIFLGNDAKRIDFITNIDWNENHKILKVAFPISVYTTEAINEIQYGYVKRPTHRSRQRDKDMYEVSQHRYTALTDGAYGAAVLNDCKYAVNVVDNEVRLTLLRAPLKPDMYADKGEHEFTYSFYPFEGGLRESEVVNEATMLNEPMTFGKVSPEYVNAGAEQLILSSANNIVIDTIKVSDTKDRALLVRAYESMGMQTETRLKLSEKVKEVVETNMLEEKVKKYRISEKTGEIKASFRAFEIKTFLLYY